MFVLYPQIVVGKKRRKEKQTKVRGRDVGGYVCAYDYVMGFGWERGGNGLGDEEIR